MRAFSLTGLALLVFVLPIRAGLYSPEEPFIFAIDSDGFAKPIQFDGGFDSIVAEMRQPSILPRSPNDKPNPVRQKYLDRVEKRQRQGIRAMLPEELAGYTCDLIRLNRAGEAINVLQPLARDPRRGGFLANTHLAVAHAATGGWREAYAQQFTAIRNTEFPASFAKLTKPQLAWLKRVEREYYLPFLASRSQEEPRKRGRDLREEVDPIFPATTSAKTAKDPVRFTGPNGEYKAGSIPESEKAKLPPDAIAIVQQLVLWHPQDPRLYWLLGELYNAHGDIESAATILDHCSFNMGYSNPTLVRHKQILQQAAAELASQKAAEAQRRRQAEEAEKQRAEEEKREFEERERSYQKRKWWIISIAVALGVLLVYYQLREVSRRIRRNRGA